MAESGLPATEIAFRAFAKGETRGVLLGASAAYLLLTLILLAASLAIGWGAFVTLLAWYLDAMRNIGQGGAVPQALPALGVLAVIWPTGAVLGWILFAAYEAACLRWLVRGERGGGLFGLTLAADTWRVFATYFVWVVLGCLVVALIVAFYLGMRALSSAVPGLNILVAFLSALAPLGFLALLIWGAVTFAPAAAASVAKRRFAFFEALSATRGNFWPLLGAFAILFAGYMGVSAALGQIVQIPLMQAVQPIYTRAVFGGGGAEFGPELIQAFRSPLVIGSMIGAVLFSVVLSCVFHVAMFGANARVVQAALEQGKIEPAMA